MDMITRLRAASEDDVRQALEETALYGFPQDEADLLRFFKAMIDVLSSEERQAAKTAVAMSHSKTVTNH
jgi:hypothetical protein